MSLYRGFDKQRQVIPRWHTYPMARWLGVTRATREQSVDQPRSVNYEEKIRSWENNRKLLHAADLVGNALVLNQFDDANAKDAALFVLEQRDRISAPLLEVAQNFIRLSNRESFPLPDAFLPEESNRFYSVIAELKRGVRDYPRDPILWMDLAFFYCAIGQINAADQAVTVALSMNGENRYLLRSASRFYMHVNAPDKALYFLRKSSVLDQDPWLLAAEIAISDTINVVSRKLKRGREIVGAKFLNRFHISELASALGTIEFKNGAFKKGKKLFATALEDPTENSLAQATHFSLSLGEIEDKISANKLSHSFEAETRLRFFGGDFTGALEAAKKWFAYQPFSARPAASGSYIAAVALGQFQECTKIAKLGLLASPDDLLLINNLAFSLASLDRTDEASKVLATAKVNQSDAMTENSLLATRALIEFRAGDFASGRKLYDQAVNAFRKHGDHRSETIAKFYWGREESRARSIMAGKLMEEALAAAKKLDLREILMAAKLQESGN